MKTHLPTFSHVLRLGLIVFAGLFLNSTNAQLTAIIDTTPLTATNDGTINGVEYVGSSTGINTGFGNVIGSGSQLHLDSDLSGNLNLGFNLGPGTRNDVIVIYLDSDESGGFTDLSQLGDDLDKGRASICGIGNSSGGGCTLGTSQADITFPSGFAADYAIVIEDTFAGLFQLLAGGSNSLSFIANLNLTGTSDLEMNLTLADLGLSPGDSFDYIATYGNPCDGNGFFRSDEFHGVASSTVSGNPANGSTTLAAGDFNTFQSVDPCDFDSEAPVITCLADEAEVCPADLPAPDITLVTASDNCGSVTITHEGDVSDGGFAPEIITRTYRATDDAGNFSECTQTFTIQAVDDADGDGIDDACDDCPLAVDGITNFNTTTCNCDPGYFQTTTEIGGNTVITACTICPPGFSCPDGIAAIECPVGRFQSLEGQTECIECEAGEFNPNTGATSCQACPAGFFSDVTGAENCVACSAGTFSSNAGATSCEDCPENTFNPIEGASSCQSCDSGSSSDPGSTECTPIVYAANLAVSYTEASENIVVTFDLTGNSVAAFPIPGLDPTIPADLAAITAKYVALQTAISTSTGVEQAALDLGDDIITEYFYMDGTNEVYLQTVGSSDIIKTKYWDQYLNNTTTSTAYPNFGTNLFDVPTGSYSTSTNPLTGLVSNGWLAPVYGKDLHVRVTVVNNGNVNIQTATVPIGPGPVNVYSDAALTNLVSSHLAIQSAIDASTTLDGYFITVADGTYDINSGITINKNGISLIGESKTGVILDGSASTVPYGVTVDANDVSLSNFTVEGGSAGPGAPGPIVFGIRVSPDFYGFSADEIVANNCNQNGIAFSGVLDNSGSNPNSISNFSGAGNLLYTLGIASSVGVTVDNVTGDNIGLYKGFGAYTQAMSDVVFTNMTLTGGFVIENLPSTDPLAITYSTADNTDADYNASAGVIVPAAFDHGYHTSFTGTPFGNVDNVYLIPEAFIPTAINLTQNGPFTVGNEAVRDLSLGRWEVSESTAAPAYALTIQEAIDIAAPGDDIFVFDGTYAENVTLDEALTLTGPNAGTSCDSRLAEAIIAPASGLPVNITSDGVTFNGFEINAPDHNNAIALSDRSNVTVSYNNINDIGTNLTGGGNIHAIVNQIGSGASSDVTISNNCLDNIGNSGFSNFSLSAIGILQSASTGVLTNLNITDNTISNLNVNTAPWPAGKIAYGIQVNVGGGSGYLTTTGKVVDATISGNDISSLEGFISTGIGLEGNTENAVISSNRVSNLTGHKLANRAGGGYDLNGLKFENNKYIGTITVENNSFEANTFTYGPTSTSSLGYAVANYVPSADAGVADLNCNWFGTANYDELVAEYTGFTGKIFTKEGAGTQFVEYLTNSTIDSGNPSYSCTGIHAGVNNLAVTYTEASENVVVTFETTGNSTMIYPVPELNPTDPTDFAEIFGIYNAFGAALASGDAEDIKETALNLGDDIITEYYYYDNNDPNTGNLVYLQTAGGNNLIKNKYFDRYLNNTSNGDRYPDFANTIFEVPETGLSTSTNPNTGGTVITGWLEPVCGKDLYVRVTLVHNGNVDILTEKVAIEDTELPTISCPADITLTTDAGQCSAVVTYATPTITDNCPASIGVSTLELGDLAFTGYSSDTPDQFSFVILVDILAGTEIRFTDNGWFAGGGFRMNEGETVWIADVDYPAGTQVIISDNGTADKGTSSGNIALAGSGDQLFAFQGTMANPSLITGIQNNGTGWEANATSSNTSAKPAAFIDGVNSISLPEIDNDFYNCLVLGPTAEDVRLAVNDATNWTNGTNSNVVIPSCAFDIQPPLQPILVSGLASGAEFPVGNTLVEYMTSDAAGNSASCSFTVTVNDTQAPTITAPADVTVSTDAGTCEATSVAIGTPVTADNCSGQTALSDAPANFPVGNTVVTWTVTDSSGNSATDTQTVTVVDSEAPAIACTDATVQLNTSGEATLTSNDILDGTATDNCSPVTLSLLGCPDDLAFDQNITPDAIFGSGNTNGAWTASTGAGVEVGLRAKVRFPAPDNVFNSNADGSYNHAVGAFGSGGIQSGWNFEWSINTDADGTSGNKLDAYTYELGLDYDPTDGVDFVTFDPINLPYADHSIGDNSTANGGGSEAPSNDGAAYAGLIANNNVAQNSWRHNFFGAFDGTVDGRYEVYLKVFDGTGTEVAMTAISVIAGSGTGNAYDGCLAPMPSLDFECADLGTAEVTLFAQDSNGNNASCNATVTIEDMVAPTVMCPNDVIQEVDAGPLCTAVVEDIAPVSIFDNCTADPTVTFEITGATSLSGINDASGTVFNLGVSEVTYTVTDDSNNQETCTFSVTIEDNTIPVLEEVTPTTGIQCLNGNNFVWTVDAADNNLFSLEVDHSLESTIPEFTVYASETDPYGGNEADFTALGASVSYSSVLQQWTIDFGADLTQLFINNGGITLFTVLKDCAGNELGSMSPTTSDNTFAYLFPNTAINYTLNGVTIGNTNNGAVDASENVTLTLCDADDNLNGSLINAGGNPDAAIKVTYTTVNNIANPQPDADFRVATFNALFGTPGLPNPGSLRLADPNLPGQLISVTTPYHDANVNGVLDPGECTGEPVTVTINLLPQPEISYTLNGVTIGNANNGAVDASENVTLTLCDADDNLNGSLINAGGNPDAAIKVTYTTVDNIANPQPDADFRVATFNALFGTPGLPNPGSLRLADPSLPGQLISVTTPYHDANVNGVLDPGECTGESITVTINLLPQPEISYTLNGVTIGNTNNGAADASENVTLTLCDADDNLNGSLIDAGGNPDAAIKVIYTTVDNIANPQPDADFRVATFNALFGTPGLPNPGSLRLDNPNLPGQLISVTTPYHDANGNGVLDPGECTGEPITVTINLLPQPEISYTLNGVTIGNTNNGAVDASENVTLTLCDADDNLNGSLINAGGNPDAAIQVTYTTVDNIANPQPDADFRVATFNAVFGTPGLPNPGSLRLDNPNLPGQLISVTTPYHDANVNGVLDPGECTGEPITVIINLLPQPEISYTLNGVTIGNTNNGAVDASENVTLTLCDADDNLDGSLINAGGNPDAAIQVTYTTVDNIANPQPDADFRVATFNALFGTPGLPNPGSLRLDNPNLPGQLISVTTPYHDANGNGVLDPGECTGESITVTINVTDELNPTFVDCPSDLTYQLADPGTCVKSVQGTIPSFSDNCTLANLVATTDNGVIISTSGGSAPGNNGGTWQADFPFGTTTVTFTGTDNLGNTAECQFTVSLLDTDAPVLDAVTPAEGDQCLLGENFIWTVDASDDNLFSLEIDHSLEATIPEFTVYASESDPYGGNEADFATLGATVVYDATSQQWTIDFGETITQQFIDNGGITFYTVIEDCNNNALGSMFATGPENTFVYTFDNEAPTINCPTDISANTSDDPSVDCGVTLSIPAVTITSDNCGDAAVTWTITYDPALGLADLAGTDAVGLQTFGVGTHTIEYRVDDTNGNGPVTCSFMVAVNDDEDPVISVNQPTSSTIECWDDAVAPTLPTVIDNCGLTAGSPSLTITGTATDNTACNGDEVIYTYTYSDEAGNSIDWVYTYTITLTTAPQVDPATAGSTVECEALAVAPTTPQVVDVCGNSLTPSGGITTEGDFDGCEGTIVYRYTYTDCALNSTDWVYTYTIDRTTQPTFDQSILPADVTEQCNAVTTAETLTATDICGNSLVVSFNETVTPGSCSSNYTLTRTWEATDCSGLMLTHSQIVTVVDNTPPAGFICPADVNETSQTGSCGKNISLVPPVTPDDNCGSVQMTVTISEPDANVFTSPAVIQIFFFQTGTSTVTYTATDECGNETTCSYEVTITDNTPPAITNCPGDEVAYTSDDSQGNCSSIVTWTAPTATDNCPGVTLTLEIKDKDGVVVPLNSGDQFLASASPYTATYTATSAFGTGQTSTTACTFSITVIDNEDPIADMATLTDVTAECSATLTVPTATDNCAGSITATTTDPTTYNDQGTYTVTWIYDDGNGNTSTQTQTVIINDITAPIIEIPSDITIECGEDSNPMTTGEASAIDNCDSAPTLEFSDSITTGDCPQESIITRTWTATDANDNSSNMNQTITVVDSTAPELTCPENVIITCEDEIPASEEPAYSDNCSDVTLSFSENTSEAINGTVITRTWTATDACGNSSSCSYTITVELLLGNGDYNNSGNVNIQDLTGFLSEYETTGCGLIGDFNGDQLVSVTDLSAFLAVFGTDL